MRTFIAIPIPQNISLFLHRIQDEIRGNQINASWVSTSSLHLTLRFIGDTPQEDVQNILGAMEATAVACTPFTLTAQGVGVFPGINKARVIWSGVNGDVEHLITLQATLEKNLVKAGIPADNRRFSPHFTLGRLKERVDSTPLKKMIQRFQHHASDSCPIQSMVLFKSDLNTWGAVHTPLSEIKFGSSPLDKTNLLADQKR
jgi:2'-5' RNA ligase